MTSQSAKVLSGIVLFLSAAFSCAHAQSRPNPQMNSASAMRITPGVSGELARSRAARIVGTRYELEYTLARHAENAPGHEELMFKVTTPGPLLLDFREGKV